MKIETAALHHHSNEESLRRIEQQKPTCQAMTPLWACSWVEEDSKDTHLSPCLFFSFLKNDTNTYYITVCLIGQRILGHFSEKSKQYSYADKLVKSNKRGCFHGGVTWWQGTWMCYPHLWMLMHFNVMILVNSTFSATDINSTLAQPYYVTMLPADRQQETSAELMSSLFPSSSAFIL